MLTFDEAAHEYRWQGKPVPHVTGILEAAGLTDYSRIPAEALAKARDEGIAVHRMVEYHFKGVLNEATLPAWMRGHFAALLRFIDETGFECWQSERQVYHHKLGYAGTLDLAGLLPKLRTSKHPAIVDVKRSFYAGPAIGLQTAAYAEAWNDAGRRERRPLVRERYALRLDAGGTYRLEPYRDPMDRIAFIAVLQQLRWKELKYGNR